MKKIFILTLVAFAISSCYYDNEEELYPSNCESDGLTYDDQMKDFIDLNCSTTGCHAARSEQPTLTNYQQVIENLDRIEARAVIERTMPKVEPLTTCEHTQLTHWIANGAPEN